MTPAFSDPLNDAGPDLSCVKPNLGRPSGGDPPIPSPGSGGDPFPIEYVLRNGKVQLNDRTVVDPGTVCAATAVTSDGRRIYLFVDANIKTHGRRSRCSRRRRSQSGCGDPRPAAITAACARRPGA